MFSSEKYLSLSRQYRPITFKQGKSSAKVFLPFSITV